MFKKILVLATLLAIAILITNRKTEAPIVKEETSNQKIISAFQDFKTFANTKPTVAAETLCQGGFINTTRSELKAVSNKIVKNRVNSKNQDDAGIICLSSADNWVLFSALNDDGYYCVDSNGKNGKFSIDRKNMTCTNTI